MKNFLLLIALVLRGAKSGVVEAPAHGVVAVQESGTSTQHRSQDIHGNYDFGYDERHTSGGSFRQETGDAYGRKYGSYGLTDADGRVRIVKYVADEHGFRATVTTNEPGTAPSTPAGVSINVPQEPTVPVPVHKVVPVATTFESTRVGPVGHPPVVSGHVEHVPVVSGPVAPAHFLSGPPEPAPVATYAAAPGVTTFKRFLPKTGPAFSYSAAPAFQSGPAFTSLSTGPAFSFPAGPAHGRRVVVRTVPAAAFSSGFVPTLPYSGAGRVVVRKAVLPSPGFYGGAGELVKSASYTPTTVIAPGYGDKPSDFYGGGDLLKSASYTPTTVVAPAYGTKLSGPSFSFAGAASSVVSSAVAAADPWPQSTATAAAEPWVKSAATADPDPWVKSTATAAAEPWIKSAATADPDPWIKSTTTTAAEPWIKSAVTDDDPWPQDAVEYGPFGTRLGAKYIRR